MELITNNLNVVWFILVFVLFAGFFLLEGFDYGTGILLPLQVNLIFNAAK